MYPTAAAALVEGRTLTVLPRHFVNVTGMASELMVRDLPFDVPPVHVDSLWHIRQGQRKEHAWLRLAVAAAAAKAFSVSRPGA